MDFYDKINRSTYGNDDAIRNELITTSKLDRLDRFFKPTSEMETNEIGNEFALDPPEHDFQNYNTLLYDIRQQQLPMAYMLDPNYAERCIKERAAGTGYISKQGVSYNTTRSIVDQESDLRNIYRLLSNDPNKKYLPCKGKWGTPEQGKCDINKWGDVQNNYNFSPSDMHNEFTRLSNPLCTIKETSFNSMQPLQLNPQDETRWLPQNNVWISTRMEAKDTFVPQTVCLHDPCKMLPNPKFN